MNGFLDSVKAAISELNVEELRLILKQRQVSDIDSSAKETKKRTSLFHDLVETLIRTGNSGFEAVPIRREENSSGSLPPSELRLRGSSTQTWSRSIKDDDTSPQFPLLGDGGEGFEEERGPQHPPWKWLRHLPGKKPDDEKRLEIAYLLSEFGEDVNAVSDDGQTPLYRAVVGRDPFLCDVFLQCGADPNLPTNGLPVITHAAHLCVQDETHLGVKIVEVEEKTCGAKDFVASRVVFELCKFYWPGLWNAVQWQSIEKVRRLLNCWCRVDISRSGESLRSFALSTGNEAIISLLLNIHTTMDIIHKCLAADIEGVRVSLERSPLPGVNLNLRKMSERGAPLLYFMIKARHTGLVRLLTEAGASPFVTMQDDDDNAREIPVVFTALHSETSPELLEILVPDNPAKDLFCLDSFRYRGKSLLRVAIEQEVFDRGILHILHVGGPSLLAESDEGGVTPLDLLLQRRRTDLISRVDAVVQEWLTRPDFFPGWRQVLTLRRYRPLEDDAQLTKSNDDDFLREARKCLQVIDQLFESAENDDQETFLELCRRFESKYFSVVDALFLGRSKNSLLPLLHWIVLHGRQKILTFVLDLYFTSLDTKQKFLSKVLTLDNVRDLWGRSALHYAYGMKNGNELVKLLCNAGATDHTLDMYYREPLDFKDARGSPAMEALLHNIQNKNVLKLNQEEPWHPQIFLRHQENQRKQRFKEVIKKHSQHHHYPHHCNINISHHHSYYDCLSHSSTGGIRTYNNFLCNPLSYTTGQGALSSNFTNAVVAPQYPNPVSVFLGSGHNMNSRNRTLQKFYGISDTQLVPEGYNQAFISDQKLINEDYLGRHNDESRYLKLCALM